MNRKNISTILSGLILVAVIVGFAVFKFVNPADQPGVGGGENIVPTKEISKNQSIGGVVAEAKKAGASAEDQITGAAAGDKNESLVKLSEHERAPKQSEIKKTIKIEYLYKALRTSNDPLTASSWALTNTKAQQAWDISTGNSVTVAVIDSGFALQHEDLSSQWQTNAGEQGQTQAGGRCWTGSVQNKMTNACDDDNNGYVDDWRGWSFVDYTNNPQAGRTDPGGAGVAHGTEVAGLVGAAGNNGIGIATFGWNTKIMPLQALDDDGSGYTSDVVAAIYYAVDNGAKVINMSLGGDTPDVALAAAINYAYTRNVVVVAAAGNCGTGQEAGCNPAVPGFMGYPAMNARVISVGAVSQTGQRASFSSYGPGLDVVAPGSGTLVSPMWRSNNQTSAYTSTLYGTSFASPYVAGYIALLKGIRPNTSVDDITALVAGSAQKVTSMNGVVYANEYGHGLINAESVLQIAQSLNGTVAATLELRQKGGYKSEHNYSGNEPMGSGCKVAPNTYCTVRFMGGNGLQYERYLPYKLSDANGDAGWAWTGSMLGGGAWEVNALQGQSKAGAYPIIEK